MRLTAVRQWTRICHPELRRRGRNLRLQREETQFIGRLEEQMFDHQMFAML